MSSIEQQQQEESEQQQQDNVQQPPFTSSWLSSFDILDEIYDSDLSSNNIIINRPEGSKLDILSRTTITEEDSPQITTTTTGICSLVSLIPFVLPDEDSPTGYSLLQSGYEGAFATLLAIQHLNTGNGLIVPEIDGLNNTCNIKFLPEFLDTKGTTKDAVSSALQRIGPSLIGNQQLQQEQNKIQPCAFIGAWRSHSTEAVSTVVGLQNYTIISGISTESALSSRTEFPYFGRTVPSAGGEAEAFISYISQRLLEENDSEPFLTILYTENDWSTAYVADVIEAARIHIPSLRIQQVLLKTGEWLSSSIAQVKSYGFPYILACLFGVSGPEMDTIMIEAVNQGVAGTGENVWFFARPLRDRLTLHTVPKDSPLHLAYRGAGVVDTAGDYFGNVRYDAFSDELRRMKQSPEIIAFMDSITPVYDYDPPVSFNESDVVIESMNSSYLIRQDSFLNPLSDTRLQYVYEATVLLGLSACAATSDDLFLDSQDLFNQVLNTTFLGISGPVNLDPATGSRIPNSTSYSMLNLVETEPSDGNVSNVAFQQNITDFFFRGNWQSIQPFVFNDGSTNFVPGKLWMNNVEVSHFSTAVRATALTMWGIAFTLALGCMAWTWKHRNTRILRASQPFFLYVICFGTIVLSKYLTRQKNISCQLLFPCTLTSLPPLISLGDNSSFFRLDKCGICSLRQKVYGRDLASLYRHRNNIFSNLFENIPNQ